MWFRGSMGLGRGEGRCCEATLPGAWTGGGLELGVSVDVESRTETPEPSAGKGSSHKLDSETSQQFLVALVALPQQTRAADARRRRPRPRPVGLLVSPPRAVQQAGVRACVSQNEVSKRRSCCSCLDSQPSPGLWVLFSASSVRMLLYLGKKLFPKDG